MLSIASAQAQDNCGCCQSIHSIQYMALLPRLLLQIITCHAIAVCKVIFFPFSSDFQTCIISLMVEKWKALWHQVCVGHAEFKTLSAVKIFKKVRQPSTNIWCDHPPAVLQPQHLTWPLTFHRLNGSSSPVLTATSLSYGKAKNSTPHRIKTPDPIEIKFSTVDYVREGTRHAKFYANPSKGGFPANGWNIRKNFYIHIPFFFFNSPTGQTLRRIFACDGSNDAVSRKDVPCGVKKFEINI